MLTFCNSSVKPSFKAGVITSSTKSCIYTDETSEQAKLRRKAMREASKQRNIYANVAAPYLAAKRTVDLAEGYRDLAGLTEDYDMVVQRREERIAKDEALAQKLAQERHADAERRKNERKMRRVK